MRYYASTSVNSLQKFEKIIIAEERIDYVIQCLLDKKMVFSDLCDVWNCFPNFKELACFDRNYFVYNAQKCEYVSITGLCIFLLLLFYIAVIYQNIVNV